jgi:hypothetical protein
MHFLLICIFCIFALTFLSQSLLPFCGAFSTAPLSSLRHWWEITEGAAAYGNGVYVATASTQYSTNWRASNAFDFEVSEEKGYSASETNIAEEWLEIKLPQVR